MWARASHFPSGHHPWRPRLRVPSRASSSPIAQYERPANGDPNGGLASTGPVSSAEFKELTLLFSDLDSGILYGTTDSFDTIAATVYALTVVDKDGNEFESLEEFAGLGRVDPRFFRFPDGSAGVLLEATGDYYRLTELAD